MHLMSSISRDREEELLNYWPPVHNDTKQDYRYVDCECSKMASSTGNAIWNSAWRESKLELEVKSCCKSHL